MALRRVLWREEAANVTHTATRGLVEERTMPGWVNATCTKHLDQSVDIHPEFTPSNVTGDDGEHLQDCPIRGDHRLDTPRCYTIMFDGSRRACMYWTACTNSANTTERVDAGVLALKLTMHGGNIARCGVICSAARRNRPPGC